MVLADDEGEKAASRPPSPKPGAESVKPQLSKAEKKERKAKAKKCRRQFEAHDKNRDGSLDVKELGALLRRGRPEMTDREVEGLFRKVDEDGSGKIDFDEFVSYVYDLSSEDDDEFLGDLPAAPPMPGEVKFVWKSYCNGKKTMEGWGFSKILKECKVNDRTFTSQKIDMLFEQIKKKGKREITAKQFEKGLRMIAYEQSVRPQELYNKIMQHGPAKEDDKT